MSSLVATAGQRESPDTEEGPVAGTGQVSLRDVWFCYPTRPDVEVLRGVSLEAAPGEVVALVGEPTPSRRGGIRL